MSELKDNPVIDDSITLEYHGPQVELGRMDSYEVAANIIGFSDFLGALSRTTYGSSVELKTEVQGFRKASFDIDFALHIGHAGGVLATLLTAGVPPSPKELFNLIKECIKAWIHLNGAPPKSFKPSTDQKNSFEIENQNGQMAIYHANVINVITDTKAGQATEQFAKKQLESGIQHVRIRSTLSKEEATFEKENAHAFVPINIEKPVSESDLTMWLLIESPTFKEGNKWRFSDGQASFSADIVDKSFLERVDKGKERFGKGDSLQVLMRQTQHRNLKTLRVERAILKVLEHKVASGQEVLF